MADRPWRLPLTLKVVGSCPACGPDGARTAPVGVEMGSPSLQKVLSKHLPSDPAPRAATTKQQLWKPTTASDRSEEPQTKDSSRDLWKTLPKFKPRLNPNRENNQYTVRLPDSGSEELAVTPQGQDEDFD